jgi:hypothetical protein
MIDSIPQDDESYLELYKTIMRAVENGQTRVHSSQPNTQWRFFDDLALEIIFSPAKCSPEEIFAKKISNAELSAIATKCSQLFKNINNVSIGLILNIDNILFTFTGDMEEVGELALIRSGLLRQSHVLKIPHHGSKTSSTENFLDIIKPKYSVISAGARNRYGHPHAVVLERLNTISTTIYRTDTDGDIHFRVIGGELQIINP